MAYASSLGGGDPGDPRSPDMLLPMAASDVSGNHSIEEVFNSFQITEGKSAVSRTMDK
ncbi:hypothetical protein PGT21_005592 [Puccinia graminis f. sp. tritici]|uniref:Uncharacterized protein n=1 Tax=Puccinia graminis f. sp. tritici TaxID=56615 RepID=A0A5B0S7X2_PUCGR|nr:hypothetical protein PGT21_005592 [Puccinia graminis f. sp. tritici]KAA1134236.1 hypothetical protein PGTUg99_033555 [Puccinia graminis f. sp. tritici]